MEKSITKRKELIFKIVLCAVMAALSIALDKVSLNLGRVKITFYALPLIVVGITNGLSYGLIAGAVSGTVLQLTSPYGVGPTSVFWGLAPVAWGGISGLANLLLKKKINNRIVIYSITIVLASIIANLLNTFAMFMDSLLVKDSYYTAASILVDWPLRLLVMLITIVPYILITSTVCESLNKVFGFNEVKEVEEGSKLSESFNYIGFYVGSLSLIIGIMVLLQMLKNGNSKFTLIFNITCIILPIASILMCFYYNFKHKEKDNKKLFSLIGGIISIVSCVLAIFLFILPTLL